jgi:hypothetical protein
MRLIYRKNEKCVVEHTEVLNEKCVVEHTEVLYEKCM